MSSFVCQSCGRESKKWTGKCNNCNEWNAIVEQERSKHAFGRYGKVDVSVADVELLQLKEISQSPTKRISSGIKEFDNVLGGGFVAGGTILIGGEPGIGKSTLLLHLAQAVSKSHYIVYLSGEESASQINTRASRLGISRENNNITLIANGSILGAIKAIASKKVDFLFIDSVQTVFIDTIETTPGTVTQVRAVTMELVSFCKKNGIVLILVGHVTKDGGIAGPKLLEHMVDSVVYFEGDNQHQFRILRTIKNRFGPTNEIGVFSMQNDGLIEIPNPSVFFAPSGKACGDIVFVAMEGTRCVAVAVESLVAKSHLASPRRSVLGWDHNRLAMILAIVQTHCKGMFFHDKDVYLSMAGGFKTFESANDLAVSCSIIAAQNQLSLPHNIVALGEVSLKGDVRQVPFLEARFKEARRLGYDVFILPECTITDDLKRNSGSIKIHSIGNIKSISNLLCDYL